MLPIARNDLGARIELLRDLLDEPRGDKWIKPAEGLASLLVRPIQNEQWLDGVSQLYVVPHGVLNYLPFALLPQQRVGDKSLLIDTYSIAYLPTAAVLLRDARKPNGPQSLLAMSPNRSRLRYAPDEVRSIDALFRPRSEMLLGVDATESRFKSLAGKHGVLHLATHGQFNKLNPLLSGLELEADGIDDGMLQVHEVLGLRLNADLVTLSACDTALGSGHLAMIPAGDEFVGMTRAFLSAGSSSVVATLWEVDDRSSGKLMRRFYEHLAQSTRPADKAGALARAQRELRSERSVFAPLLLGPVHPGRRSGSSDPHGDSDMKTALRSLASNSGHSLESGVFTSLLLGALCGRRQRQSSEKHGNSNMNKVFGRFVAVLSVALMATTSHWVAAAPPIQVTAADPTSATQGTLSLDVTVSGSGFDSSAAVSFLVTGTTNPGGITVKNVKVTGPKKLVATIDVAEAAAIANFDIQVTQSGGRKGKGTSLFAVLAKASNDPCAAAGIDFPAFTFRGPTEATEEVIYVADANGTCIREIGKFTVSASDASSTIFSYPVAGTADVGRIVWGEHDLYSLTFLVTGTTVTPYSVELLYEQVGPDISAFDMSKDGSTVYAALDAVDPTHIARIVAITVSDRSSRDVYAGPADSSDIRSIAVDESGTLVVQQVVPIGDSDDFTQILRIDPGCDNPSCATIFKTAGETDNHSVGNIAASLVDDRFVYEHSGITPCSPVLQVMSIAGGPVLNAATPMFGRRSSWYGGKILTNGFKVNKRGCTISTTISQFDPDTGAETILVRGFDPDGR